MSDIEEEVLTEVLGHKIGEQRTIAGITFEIIAFPDSRFAYITNVYPVPQRDEDVAVILMGII